MSNQDTDFYAAASFIKKDEDQNFYLSAQQCNACDAIFLDNRISCSRCFELNNFSTIRLSDTGSLYSYSIVHRSFPGIEVPYISAIVDLDNVGTFKGNWSASTVYAVRDIVKATGVGNNIYICIRTNY